ncbi:MAG: TolC family protein [Bacteroidetes bacterium]|nr:MAG: TolC family protein [Bacteroidota bacterium]MBL1144360.1 TolC family protein [Bacteroidota bacterium]NOG57156.1 TolC family protein [Bacteroidota bacterium]
MDKKRKLNVLSKLIKKSIFWGSSIQSSFQLLISCIVIILISIITSKPTYAQKPLDNYITIAAENNPSLKATYTEFEVALQQVNQVKALEDPRLSFGYFISPIEKKVGAQRAKLSLTQTFPWFGTLKSKANIATYLAEAKYQTFINERNKLIWEVNKAYYPIYEYKKQFALLEDNLQILQTYKRLALSAYENNRGALADVIRVDIMIEDAKIELKILNDQLRPLAVRFNQLLNRSDTFSIETPDTISSPLIGINYRRDSLFVENPMIQSLEIQKNALLESEKLAKKNALPQFGVGLDYTIIGKRTDMSMPKSGNDLFMPMISVSLPIYRKKYKAAITESQLNQKAIEYRKEAVENDLISNYENAAFQLNKSTELILLYNSQITKTKQLIQLLYASYSNSTKEFEEVLRMQQQLLKYQMSKATAEKNYQVALAEIEYLTFGG